MCGARELRLEGLEQTPLAGPKTPISQDVRTDSSTVESKNPPQDADLAFIGL
jgi:hypothetical protein